MEVSIIATKGALSSGAAQTNFLLSTDPLGRVTRFTSDALGNVTSITDPAGNVRTFTYEPTFSRVTSVSVTDRLRNLTRFEYNLYMERRMDSAVPSRTALPAPGWLRMA